MPVIVTKLRESLKNTICQTNPREKKKKKLNGLVSVKEIECVDFFFPSSIYLTVSV